MKALERNQRVLVLYGDVLVKAHVALLAWTSTFQVAG